MSVVLLEDGNWYGCKILESQALEFRPVEGEVDLPEFAFVRVEVKCFWRGEVEGKEVCSGLR